MSEAYRRTFLSLRPFAGYTPILNLDLKVLFKEARLAPGETTVYLRQKDFTFHPFRQVPYYDIEQPDARRRVFHLGHIVAQDNVEGHLGLTVHLDSGSWSSWPPHSFEIMTTFFPHVATAVFFDRWAEEFLILTDRPEGLVAVYQFEPDGSLGQMGVYAHGNAVGIVLGPHPVVAFPGVRAGYVWVYRAPISKFEGLEPAGYTSTALLLPGGEK